MISLFDIDVILRGSVHDLAKTVGVLALMSLTPRTFTCEKDGERLNIHMRLSTSEERMDLLAARLRNFFQIAAVNVAEVDPCSGHSA